MMLISALLPLVKRFGHLSFIGVNKPHHKSAHISMVVVAYILPVGESFILNVSVFSEGSSDSMLLVFLNVLSYQIFEIFLSLNSGRAFPCQIILCSLAFFVKTVESEIVEDGTLGSVGSGIVEFLGEILCAFLELLFLGLVTPVSPSAQF